MLLKLSNVEGVFFVGTRPHSVAYKGDQSLRMLEVGARFHCDSHWRPGWHGLSLLFIAHERLMEVRQPELFSAIIHFTSLSDETINLVDVAATCRVSVLLAGLTLYLQLFRGILDSVIEAAVTLDWSDDFAKGGDW